MNTSQSDLHTTMWDGEILDR